jgi:hypothetical protein
VTAPSTWDNPDLSVYFTRVPSFTARSATRSISNATATPSETSGSSSKSNVGAIAGGVVGGLVGLIAILSLILFCLHRRKKAKKNKDGKQELISPPPVELGTSPPRHEMESPGATKYINMHQPDNSAHPAFSGNSVHSRSPSDPHSQTSPYSPSAAPYPSPTYGTEFFPVQANYQQNPYPGPPYSDTPESSYNNHVPQPSPPLTQQGYSYVSPISPAQPTQHPQQIYYPPPPDHSKRSHPSTSDRVDSPEGTHSQHSDGMQTPLPPSTSNTPAHFYAQPAPLRPHQGEFNQAGSHVAGGDTDSLGRVSVDSRKRPVRGRFVEVDHM